MRWYGGALRWLSAAVFLLLGACGGGGGGSTTSLSVSKTSLAFSVEQGGVAPAHQSVSVNFKGDGLLVGYPPGINVPGWLDITQLSDDAGSPQSFSIGPTTAELSPGTYTTTVRFITGHVDGSNVKTQDLAVVYKVDTPFRVAAISVLFDEVRGNPPQMQHIRLTKADGNYQVSSDQPWLKLTSMPDGGGGDIAISIDNGALADGQYSGTVTIRDMSSGRNPLAITVTTKIRSPNLLVGEGDSYFADSDQDNLPSAHTFFLASETSEPVAFSAQVRYVLSTGGWLHFDPSGSSASAYEVGPNTTVLPPGIYTAEITFSPTSGRPSVTRSITYTVAAPSLIVRPESEIPWSVDGRTYPDELSRTRELSDLGSAIEWRISTINLPWLKITPASGTTRSVTGYVAAINAADLGSMENGEYSGSIQIVYKSASTMERTIVLPVTLQLSLPTLTDLVPGVASDASGSLQALHGSGLSSATTIKIDGQNQSLPVGEYLADNLATFAIPQLQIGDYTVRLENKLGVTRPAATLKVLDTPSYAVQSLPRQASSRQVRYDPLHQIVYSLDVPEIPFRNDESKITRYRYLGSTWVEDTILNQPKIYSFDLSADGSKLYFSNEHRLYEWTIGTAITTARQMTALPGDGSYYYIARVERMADGRFYLGIWMHGSGVVQHNIYDPKANTLQTLPFYLSGSATAVSALRTRVLVGQGGSSPPQGFLYFDPSNDQYGDFGNYAVNLSNDHLALSPLGTEAVIDDQTFAYRQPAEKLAHALLGPAYSMDGNAIVGINQDGRNYGDVSPQTLEVYRTWSSSNGYLTLTESHPVSAASRWENGFDIYTIPVLGSHAVIVITNEQFFVIPIAPQ